MSLMTGVIGGIVGAFVVLVVVFVTGLLMYAHGEREQQAYERGHIEPVEPVEVVED